MEHNYMQTFPPQRRAVVEITMRLDAGLSQKPETRYRIAQVFKMLPDFIAEVENKGLETKDYDITVDMFNKDLPDLHPEDYNFDVKWKTYDEMKKEAMNPGVPCD